MRATPMLRRRSAFGSFSFLTALAVGVLGAKPLWGQKEEGCEECEALLAPERVYSGRANSKAVQGANGIWDYTYEILNGIN